MGLLVDFYESIYISCYCKICSLSMTPVLIIEYTYMKKRSNKGSSLNIKMMNQIEKRLLKRFDNHVKKVLTKILVDSLADFPHSRFLD